MDLKQLIATIDHTVLSPTVTWEDIRILCDDAIHYGAASVCIPPSYIAAAKEYVGDRMTLCTVIGFPNGYNTTAAKCFETADAVACGADEIDMVINIGWLKDGRYDDILTEIKAVKEACHGKLLKVIIETCLLTEEEKIKMCEIVSVSDADFIKTSTGFSTSGATPHDVALFGAHAAPHLKIKAAGGISSIADAENMLNLGASRLGTSRIIKIVKSENLL